jgi:hypothetical protein
LTSVIQEKCESNIAPSLELLSQKYSTLSRNNTTLQATSATLELELSKVRSQVRVLEARLQEEQTTNIAHAQKVQFGHQLKQEQLEQQQRAQETASGIFLKQARDECEEFKKHNADLEAQIRSLSTLVARACAFNLIV